MGKPCTRPLRTLTTALYVKDFFRQIKDQEGFLKILQQNQTEIINQASPLVATAFISMYVCLSGRIP